MSIVSKRLSPCLLLAVLAIAGCPTKPTGVTKPSTESAKPSAGPTGVKTTGSPTATPTVAAAAFLGVVLGLDGKPAVHIPVSATLMGDQGSGIISRTKLMGDQGSGIISRTKYVLGFGLQADTGLSTQTDDQGRFSFPGTAGKPFVVEARMGDDVKALGELDPAKQYLLELAHTGTISGKVKAAGVANLLGTHVFIPGTSYDANTSEDGSYTMSNVPVGSFRLVASKLGLGSAEVKPVDVTSSKATTAPDLVLSKANPDVTAVEPTAAGPGATVRLTGTNFGASSGANPTVTIGGAQASNVKQIDDHTLTFTVPPTAGSGDVVVTVETVPGKPGHLDVLQTLALVDPAPELQTGVDRAYVVTGTETGKKPIAAPVVTWRVEGGTAITVDATGKVHAAAVGKATLVAESGTIKATQAVTVGASVPEVSTLLATLGRGAGVVFDGKGKLYLSDAARNQVLAIDVDAATPVTTVVAGDGTAGFVDGPGASARFNGPGALALGPDGTLYVADAANFRVRMIAPDRTVTTLAGSGQGQNKDGDGVAAGFQSLSALALDTSQHLYLGGWDGFVHQIDLGGAHAVKTVSKPNTNGLKQEASVWGLAFLADGRLLISDKANFCVRAATTLDGTPQIVDFASKCQTLDGSATVDGTRMTGHFNAPGALAVGPDGTVYMAQTEFDQIVRAIGPADQVTTVAGLVSPIDPSNSTIPASFHPTSKDGPRGLASFAALGSLAVDARKAGSVVLYVTDGSRLRKIVIPKP
ncbi:MAG: repeat containing protein [Cyanobacteria bacterium RYN_339]|nr:repeat containing protein [Cyanobacteria bacterium RYN_339]